MVGNACARLLLAGWCLAQALLPANAFVLHSGYRRGSLMSVPVVLRSSISRCRRERDEGRCGYMRTPVTVVRASSEDMRPSYGASAQAEVDVRAILTSENWPSVKERLNDLPVFAVVEPDGSTTADFVVEVEGRRKPVSSFYVEVDDAIKACEKFRKESRSSGARVFPFPLGDTFERSLQSQAVLFASERSLVDAGVPAGTSPEGMPVPLFACMEVMIEGMYGNDDQLPLFLDKSAADAAVQKAMDESDVSADDASRFEIIGIVLHRAIEILATDPDTPPFVFIPPASSVNFVEELRRQEKK